MSYTPRKYNDVGNPFNFKAKDAFSNLSPDAQIVVKELCKTINELIHVVQELNGERR